MAAALVLASVVALGVPMEHARAAFPGINGKIVFEKPWRNGGIYTISLADNNLKYLASNSYSRAKDSLIDNADPSWSPNGKKIVFARNNDYNPRARPNGRTDIYIMNADGSNKRLVTNERLLPGDPKDDEIPSFSSSGRKIIFSRDSDLYTIRPDGSGLTNLTNDGKSSSEYGPVWSPDGTKIAYGDDYGISVMNSDGSSPTQIAADDSLPDWSPDGTQIAYGSGTYGVMNADGSDPTILSGNTRWDNSYRIADQTAAFSPGGGEIVFSAARDGDYDLYIINTDGSGLRRLTNLSGYEAAPDWQPVQ
jgi:TolB protein